MKLLPIIGAYAGMVAGGWYFMLTCWALEHELATTTHYVRVVRRPLWKRVLRWVFGL